MPPPTDDEVFQTMNQQGGWTDDQEEPSLSIKQVMAMAHSTAIKKGIWERENRKSDIECMALVGTEVSECIEVMRLHDYNPTASTREYSDGSTDTESDWQAWVRDGGIANPIPKPAGLPSELADIIIRVCDFAAYRNIDLDAAVLTKLHYNETRPYMHGKAMT